MPEKKRQPVQPSSNERFYKTHSIKVELDCTIASVWRHVWGLVRHCAHGFSPKYNGI